MNNKQIYFLHHMTRLLHCCGTVVNKAMFLVARTPIYSGPLQLSEHRRN